MLLVEKLTSAKPNGDFEVEFSVGEKAVVQALQLSTLALRASEQVGSHPEDLVNALSNQAKIAERTKDALARYARAWLSSQVPEHIGKAEVFRATTSGLDRKTLSEEATRRTQSARSICILADESEKLVVVVAVSKDLVELDANAMLQELLREHGGKGGGNRNFASGGLNEMGMASTILEKSGELIRSKITQGHL
jgi:alanyl-tRNA synthetase